MPETFFISDTHFGHSNIIKFESTKPYRDFKSIEEQDEELIKRWNSVVGKKDNAWHLGDFCFGKKNIKIAERLNGYKRLILGNHDLYETSEYLKYFAKVYGIVEYKKMILSHAPLHISQMNRWIFNIHGHLHTKVIGDHRYLNVSCEQINLTPINLDSLLGANPGLSLLTRIPEIKI